MSDEREIEIVTCWCGVTGRMDEMFDDEVFSSHCGGTGVLHCECGGDICVCHNHGEVDCPGCADCDIDDNDDFADEHFRD